MTRSFSIVALTLAAFSMLGVSSSTARADEPANRLFEMRTYVTNDGKMPELHKRFREHTNRLFEKHGMTLVGYWNPVEGPDATNTLVYILAYPDRESREKSWKAFQADPDWQAASKASHVNGSLVKKVTTQFLSPTDYSPIK